MKEKGFNAKDYRGDDLMKISRIFDQSTEFDELYEG